ncbi:MAG: vitamin K epoxide reductase family protein [Candidatus Pacearchaeota archaeon]
MKNLKYKLLLVFVGLAFLSALNLLSMPTSEVCNPGAGCSVVKHSIHSESFGIKNSLIGVVAFGLTIFLVSWHLKFPRVYKKNLINYGIVLGSLVAGYFIYLQAFELKSFCKYCMVADTSILISLIVVLLRWKE